jgi:ribonucrease Y
MIDDYFYLENGYNIHSYNSSSFTLFFLILSFLLGFLFGLIIFFIFNYKKINKKILAQKSKIEEELKIKDEKNKEKEFFFLNKEINLNKKEEFLEIKLNNLFQKEKDFEFKESVFQEKVKDIDRKLEILSKMDENKAKEYIFKNVESKYSENLNKLTRIKRKEIEDNIKFHSINILASALERYASNFIDEKTVSFIDLPDEKFKNRLIGREGRNIKAFIHFTGTDLIIDETPNVVKISTFDPIRREIAVKTLKKLILDNKIQPIEIKKIYEQEKINFVNSIHDIGNMVLEELGLNNFDQELIKLVGKLKFRTSYGQNLLTHSLEVAKFSSIIASELNLDENLAKRAGILHDIGKIVSNKESGSHVYHGVLIAQKYQESEEIINVIQSHHGDVEKNNIYSFIVSAADTLSSARLGARNNTIEEFKIRVRSLEKLCNDIEGVESSYVLKSGREICIFVDSKKIDDYKMLKLTEEVKKKIKISNVIIPGDINITVIRETIIKDRII